MKNGDMLEEETLFLLKQGTKAMMYLRREHKPMHGVVTAVSYSLTHSFAKPNQESIRLLPGLGVEGDAHLGVTVQHRSRVARDPS